MREDQQLPSSGRIHKSCHIVTVLFFADLTRQSKNDDPLYILSHSYVLLVAWGQLLGPLPHRIKRSVLRILLLIPSRT